jgi:predicted ATPase
VTRIVALEFKNFQTFGEHTIVPIRQLTLMFGPNGAGKSSIFDGFELLRLISSDDWGESSEMLLSQINKWSRNSKSDQPTNSLGIGIQIKIEDDWSSDAFQLIEAHRIDSIHHYSLRVGGDYEKEFIGKVFRFYLEFQKIPNGYLEDWYFSQIHISLDGVPVLELKKTDEHDAPVAYVAVQDWFSLSSTLNQLGKTKIKNNSKNLENEIFLENKILYGLLISGFFSRSSSRRWFGENYLREHEYEFNSFVQQLVDFARFVLRAELSSGDIVEGSRKVPSPRDCIRLVNGTASIKFPFSQIKNSELLKAIEQDINNDLPLWGRIAQAVADAKCSSDDNLGGEWYELNKLSKINSFLTEELFHQNGYQLSGQVILLDQDVDCNGLEEPRYYCKLVKVFLLDNFQKRVEIEDVGSGIGYVLPVVESLCDADISLIQQPELHLHPALQGALGEVIVKAVENKLFKRAFTVIETHSEHILLRILKLIKNAKKRESEVLTALNFERISILYFDPMPNGETKVKRLRVAPDGQIIDRWPGGFFNERLNDILDE